jgi:hypothetical protein
MKKIIWLVVIVIIITAGILVYKNKMPNSQKNNQEKLSFSVEAIHQTDSFYDIQVEYPQFQNLKDFNAEISDLVSQKIIAFKEESKNNWEARKATATPDNPVPENPESPFPFIVEWKPVQMNDNYISFVLHLYYFVGGAHGANEISAFNYNLKAGKKITIMDFLNSSQEAFERLAVLAKQEVTSQLQSNGVPIDDSLKQMIENGTKPVPENYQNFNFGYNSLIIYFQQYQVAPGAAGEITVNFYKNTLESNSIPWYDASVPIN